MTSSQDGALPAPPDEAQQALRDSFAQLATDDPGEYAAIVPDDAFLEAFGVTAP